MKYLFTFIIGFIICVPLHGQDILPETNKNQIETPMGSTYWKTSYSINKYYNFKTGLSVEWHCFESNALSLATVTSASKKTYISSNGLFSVASFACMPLFKKERKYFALLLLTPEIVGNAKCYVNVIGKHVDVGVGQNTDYYFFYSNAKIYTESMVSFKLSADKIRCFLDYRIPLTKGYMEDRKPYFTLSIGLFPSYYD